MQDSHIFMIFAMFFGSTLTVYPILEVFRSASILDTRHYSIFLHVGPLVSSWTWGLACHQQASCEDVFFFYNMWIVLFEIGMFITFVSTCKTPDDKTRGMVWAMPISICMIGAFVLWLLTDLGVLVKGLEALHAIAASFGICGYLSGSILLKWPCSGWCGADRRGAIRRPLPNGKDFLFLLLAILDAVLWALYASRAPAFIFEVQAWTGVALLTWQFIATIFVRWSRKKFNDPENPVKTFMAIAIDMVTHGCNTMKEWINTWKDQQTPAPPIAANQE